MKPFLAFALLFVSATAFAGSDFQYAHPGIEHCQNTASSNADQGNCLQDLLVQKDAELNTTYQALKTGLQKSYYAKEITALLVDAQRSWIQLRDKQCEFESATFMGGNGRGLVETQCLVVQTEKRTEELKSQFDRFGL